MRLLFVLGAGLLTGLVTGHSAHAMSNPGFDFSIRLFKSLAKSHASKNLVFSPFSVRHALGMVGSGARGRTAKQLGKAPEPWASKKEPSYRLMVANRLWVHLTYPLQEPYMDASDKNFGVRPWMVDFSKGPDFLRDRINGWVSERTSGKVKSVVTEDSIDPSMRMLLTSSVYFKGDWVYPFERSETQENKFVTESDGTVKVPFMAKRGSFNYLKIHDAQILEVPYQDGEISMVLLLPNAEDGLSRLENNLKYENLEKWLEELAVRETSLSLPKFEFDSSLNLKEALQTVGVSDAFEAEAADFSGMNGNKDLFISTLLHQSTIGMSEVGTEAISYSNSGPSRGLASVPSHGGSAGAVFKADHPFVFLIRHRGSNSILFMGHVAKPMMSKIID